ncbi:hypothetical protein TRVL_02447 [Trypanosoma vivax]|nr:hypothetical protein TRVL_02447 [Trypanosoma vivax]
MRQQRRARCQDGRCGNAPISNARTNAAHGTVRRALERREMGFRKRNDNAKKKSSAALREPGRVGRRKASGSASIREADAGDARPVHCLRISDHEKVGRLKKLQSEPWLRPTGEKRRARN